MTNLNVVIELMKQNKKIIEKYIALPFIIKKLGKNKELFKQFLMWGFCVDIVDLDLMIKNLKEEHLILKKVIKYKYGLHIKKTSTLQYIINGQHIKYTSEEINGMISQLLLEHINQAKIQNKSSKQTYQSIPHHYSIFQSD